MRTPDWGEVVRWSPVSALHRSMEETDAIESLYQEIASLDYHWESLIPTSDILQTLQDPLTFDSEVWTQLIPSRLVTMSAGGESLTPGFAGGSQPVRPYQAARHHIPREIQTLRLIIIWIKSLFGFFILSFFYKTEKYLFNQKKETPTVDMRREQTVWDSLRHLRTLQHWNVSQAREGDRGSFLPSWPCRPSMCSSGISCTTRPTTRQVEWKYLSNNKICFQVVTWQDEKEGTFRITREGHFEILSNAQLWLCQQVFKCVDRVHYYVQILVL